MRSKIILSLIIASLLMGGCVEFTPGTPAQVDTPAATIMPTTSTPMLPPPTPTPELVLLRAIFDNKYNSTYIKTSGSKIYAGEMNGDYVSFIGLVFSVKPRATVEDRDSSEFEVIDFQVWGNVLRREDPLYIDLYIEAMPEKINGTVRSGVKVQIEGYVSKEWMSGKNAYGGTINQPFIYAHNVSVIPEWIPE